METDTLVWRIETKKLQMETSEETDAAVEETKDESERKGIFIAGEPKHERAADGVLGCEGTVDDALELFPSELLVPKYDNYEEWVEKEVDPLPDNGRLGALKAVLKNPTLDVCWGPLSRRKFEDDEIILVGHYLGFNEDLEELSCVSDTAAKIAGLRRGHNVITYSLHLLTDESLCVLCRLEENDYIADCAAIAIARSLETHTMLRKLE